MDTAAQQPPRHRARATSRPTLSVERWPVERLKPSAKALKRHPDKQIALLAAGIRKFGCLSAIVVDEEDVILKGHAVCEAARQAGLLEVNVIRAAHLNQAEKRAYRIADNKLAELSCWDEELLRVELTDLSALELNFDLALTGFSTTELDLIVDGPPGGSGADEADELPALKANATTQSGDLWCLGEHRLLCGDALKAESYATALAGRLARLAICDVPYNVPIAGHVSGMGRHVHREFAMASGEMSSAQFAEFLATAFQHLAAHSMEGALHYHFIDHAHIDEMVAAGGKAYSKRLNMLVWAKTNGGMGAFYRSRHELIFLYKKGAAAHVNNIQLGKDGRYRTNVLEYPGANSFGREREEDLARHPTSKPWRLIADLICDASHPGEIVLDAFAGGGTVFVAAEKTRRRAVGIEIDPLYCDLSVDRWQRLTGKEAVLTETGETYEQVRGRRAEAGAGAEKAVCHGN